MEKTNQNESHNKLFIGVNLKKLRKLHNLSTCDVAKILGKTRQGYTNYENGNREINIHDLITLSGYYNVTIDKLVDNPFSFKRERSLSFRSFEKNGSAYKEILPIEISTILDDVIIAKEDDLAFHYFWKTNTNQHGHEMLFEFHDKFYISKVFYDPKGSGYFLINDEPYFFSKAKAENILFKGVLMASMNKRMPIPYFF